MYNTAVVIQAQLEKIGVKSELNVVDWATLLQIASRRSFKVGCIYFRILYSNGSDTTLDF